MAERAEGFYWVRPIDQDWTIAAYRLNTARIVGLGDARHVPMMWYLPGNTTPYEDEEFTEIGDVIERRPTAPRPTKVDTKPLVKNDADHRT